MVTVKLVKKKAIRGINSKILALMGNDTDSGGFQYSLVFLNIKRALTILLNTTPKVYIRCFLHLAAERVFGTPIDLKK